MKYLFEIDIMKEDTLCTNIKVFEIERSKRIAEIKNFVSDFGLRLVGSDRTIDFADLYELLFNDRCISQSRNDAKRLLDFLQLPVFDSYAICRKTNGVMRLDYFWLNFSDNKFDSYSALVEYQKQIGFR